MRDHPAIEIQKVKKGSLAQQLGLRPGQRLISINGQRLADEFDYRFAQADEHLDIEYFDEQGSRQKVSLEKDADEDLGLDFAETPFRSCKVKCVFCFIDQNPKGMRQSIYFKDEDYRFSFLYGNYVTLFNMSEEDMQKAIERRMSPMYISVHTTNEVLRSKLLGIKKPTHILERLKRLAQARIEMHAQIVVCPGLNDGETLKKTVFDLAELHPQVASIACVPVGLTKYREKLKALRLATQEEARGFLTECHAWQQSFLQSKGTRLVFASDEWYLKAGWDLPSREVYEGFPQLANGVGLISTFLEEFEEALPGKKALKKPRRITAVTGKSFAPFLRQCAERICSQVRGLEVDVRAVENRFFGEGINVAGLLTGQDVQEALLKAPLGDEVLLPHVMLRDRSHVFLDDMEALDLATAVKRPLRIISAEAAEFVRACLKPLPASAPTLFDEGPAASADRELPEGMFAGSVLR